MAAHGFLTPAQCDALNSLLNASDAWVLRAYRAFQAHRDVRRLKDDLVGIAEDRRAAARAVKAAGVEDFFPRMIAFVEHLERVGMVTAPQAEVLYDLVDAGAAVVLAAYHAAREKNDPEALVAPLRQIADFYLEEGARLSDSSGGEEEEEEEEEEDDEEQGGDGAARTARPPTPSPYSWSEEEGEGDGDSVDPLDLIEMLVDTGLVSGASAPALRDVVVSNNPYVEAAIELYHANGDAEDLVDTLRRLVPDAAAADAAGAANLANAVYAEQQRNDASWASAEAALRLIGALTEEELFSEAAGARLQDLLTIHFGTSQQQVLVAAYEVYEQDGDASEFVDTCLRVLRQIEELASKHASAFALIISDAEGGGSFSPQAQDVLMALWRAMEPRVMAAWDVFLEDQHMPELVDTLSRIIALEFSIDEAHDSDTEEAAAAAAAATSTTGTTTEDFVAVMNNVMQLMLEEGHTDVEGAAVLAKLLDEQNPVVQAAYDAFCADEDVDELVDTLVHTISYVQDNTDTLNCAELFDFVETIVSNDKMTAADGEVAAALIERRDPRVMAAYDVYFEDQDVHELIDTIERTVHTVRAMFGAQRHVVVSKQVGAAGGANIEQERASSSSEEESAEEESEDDDSSGGGDAELVEGSEPVAVLQQVVAAAYNTGKIQYETALELMKPSSMVDPRFLAALDIFAEEKDLDDLFDSLGRIGRVMIGQSTPSSSTTNYSTAPAAAAEQNATASGDSGDSSSLVSDSEMSMDDSALDTTIDYNQFGEDDSDSEWDRAGDSWDEDLPLPFSSSSSSSSEEDESSEDRHADSNGYEHTYVELAARGGSLDDADQISDLLNKLNLSDENMQQLSDLMNSSDPVISAAFQVYETDGDVHDLKDTLLRVLARVNFAKGSSDAPVQPVSKVLGDLVNADIISEGEGKTFQFLLNDDHPIASAALEVYGVDGDWEEFVDTMRRIC
jgi:hypothetical protein